MEVYDPYTNRFVDMKDPSYKQPACMVPAREPDPFADMIGRLADYRTQLIQDQKETIDILEAALRLYRDFANEVQSITESVDCYDMDKDLEAALSDLDKGLKELENKYVSKGA